MLKCPVCQVPYTTNGEQQPRLLVGCGHTFCSKCLSSRHMDNEPLTCPQCSLVNEDPHVPNITIMGYVEATATPSPVLHPIPPPQKVLCQDCKEKQATLICFQCLAAGFKFCDDCSAREHNRDFGPVKGHAPQPIENAATSMPVPSCKQHPDKPCLYFSYKVNRFACEDCRDECNFAEDAYISVDVAISQIRDEVPSLMSVIRDRVDTISQTRTELDQLLGRVEQEKARALDHVRSEFGRLEAAIRKRHGELLEHIEQEAQFQRKSLLEQQEKLEVAQGNADTAIVRGNWLLQMSDYNYLHQADAIISTMRDQLNDQEYPIYQMPVTKGGIPIFIPSSFVEQIESLGKVGGGKMPSRLSCSVENGMLMLSWEQSDDTKEYEVRYEPAEEEEVDPLSGISKEYIEYKSRYPSSIPVRSSISKKMIDDIMPGKKYCFRVRALNVAGWGIWSYPKIGSIPNFPLTIGYSGEIVHVELPFTGLYQIIATGAKAADGDTRKGGIGAIIEAKFYLNKYDKLIILCGGMSKKVHSSSGGAGGTFVALNRRKDILVVAGGGGGTRGHDAEDIDGKDANIESENGMDGAGAQWASGGASGGAGKDAWFTGPCWGYGGAGFNTASTTAKSFLHGGEPGEGGGFGGGGAVGHYGGGGGGGYSGGGGGRGGGGGGSFVRDDGMDQKKLVGGMEDGSVYIVRVDTD